MASANTNPRTNEGLRSPAKPAPAPAPVAPPPPKPATKVVAPGGVTKTPLPVPGVAGPVYTIPGGPGGVEGHFFEPIVDPASPKTPGITAPGSGPDPYDQSSARGILGTALASIGLEDMTDWAYAQLTAGNAPEEILLNLRQTDRYKQRFIANDYRKKAGLNPLSESDIISYETGFRSLMNQYGVPSTLYSSTADIAKFIGQDLGIPELTDRIKNGFADVQGNPGLRAQFRDWYGPDGDTALALYFMDHENSLPLLQKQIGAGTLGATATRYGYTVGKQRAEELASAGINLDPMSVNNAFAHLAKIDPLFHATAEEGNLGTAPTIQQQGLDAVLGTGPGGAELDKEMAARQAAFGGGGAVKLAQERTGFATSGQ